MGLELFQHQDKVAHFLMYALVGATLAWAQHRGDGKPSDLLLLGGGVTYAALDEFHQAFVPRRDPSLPDLGADLAGLFVGYKVVQFMLRYFLGESRD